VATEFPVSANTKPAEQNINHLIDAFKKLGKEAGIADDKIEGITSDLKKMGTDGANNVSKIKQSMGGLDGTVKRLGTGIVALFAVDKLIEFSKHLIGITSSFQKYEALLKNTFGSRSQAMNALVNIANQAARTNFSLDEVTNGYLKLANNGIKPTNDEMTAFFDLTNNAGKGFDMFVEAVNDAVNGEFERLKEFFIKGSKDGDKITLMFKGQKHTVDNNAESIKNLLVQLGQLNGVSGSTAAIAGTLEGKLSNLGDNFDQIVKSLGDRSGGLIGAVIDLANNALGSLNEAMNDQVGALQAEQMHLNVLVGAITQTNVSEEARKNLIEELNRTYPDFLKNLNAEKVTNEELKGRLEDVNEQFVRKITLMAAEERMKETQEEVLDLIDKEVEARKEIERIKNGERIYHDTEESGMRGGMDAETKRKRDIANLEHEIYEIQEERITIQKEVTNRLNEYQAALGIFNTTQNDYFTGTESATKATEKLGNELKKLKDIKADDTAQLISNAFDEAWNNTTGKTNKAVKEINSTLDKHVKHFQDGEKKKQDATEKRLEQQKRDEEDALDFSRQIQIDAMNAIFDMRSDSIDRELDYNEAKRNRELELAGDNEEAKDKINQKFDKKQRDLQTRQAQIARQQAIFNLAISLGPAIGKTVETLGFPLAIPFVAAVGVLFASLITKTKTTDVPKFRDGVFNLDGAGTATSDSIDARLSRGETVVTAARTSKFGDILKPMIENESFEWVDLKRIVDQKVPTAYAMIYNQAKGGDSPEMLDELRKTRKALKKLKQVNVTVDRNGLRVMEHEGNMWTEYLNSRYQSQ